MNLLIILLLLIRYQPQTKNISFNCITLGDGAESRIDIAIDTAADNDGWLVIEDLHLASANLLAGLRHQLIRVGNTGGEIGI